MHFRLSRGVTYQLIARFERSDIFTSLQEHAGYKPITPEKHILSYLWFLGHESAGYRDVADRFAVTISTMDGTYIRVDKPEEDPDSYINRKQYFSIHIQGTVDHKMKFLDVFIGFPGSVHDARVFRNSPLYESLQEICTGGSYLLGDSAYPCLPYLMVPYRDNGDLTRAQRNFNQRLSSCRVVVENAFGCLKQRFRQLYHLKLRNIIRMVQVIHACCVLHNLANLNNLELFEPIYDNEDPDPEARIIDNANYNDIIPDNHLGRELRDELCRQLLTY